jgi:hypothetical protein
MGRVLPALADHGRRGDGRSPGLLGGAAEREVFILIRRTGANLDKKKEINDLIGSAGM